MGHLVYWNEWIYRLSCHNFNACWFKGGFFFSGNVHNRGFSTRVKCPTYELRKTAAVATVAPAGDLAVAPTRRAGGALRPTVRWNAAIPVAVHVLKTKSLTQDGLWTFFNNNVRIQLWFFKVVFRFFTVFLFCTIG